MTNQILVVTNAIADARILKATLCSARDGPFSVHSVTHLGAALERLQNSHVDLVLADLTLPDSEGIATFDQLFAAVPHTPIMILSAVEEEWLAIEAVQRGAQGYLSKGHFESTLLPQSLYSVIQRKAVEEALFKEKTRAETALNSIGDAVICTDISGKVDYLNEAAERMTGWLRDEARGRPVAEIFKLVNGATAQPVPTPVDQVLEHDKPIGLPVDTILIRRDGSKVPIEDTTSPIHDWDGRLTGAVVVFHDVSIVRELTNKMAYLAQHDTLTDLPNRALLNDRIERAIAVAERKGTKFALLFLDLDNFKTINDSLGHAVGDKLLQAVTKRLASSVRNSDTVGRLGGDEFVILLADATEHLDVGSTATKILAELAVPHAIDDRELLVTASIGISVYPEDGNEIEALIQSADKAMYRAKKSGRNNYQLSQPLVGERAAFV